MIQNLRQIKFRIRSIESTRRITRAMEMVSAAKLNRVRNTYYAARPYLAGLEGMLHGLLAEIEKPEHRFLEKRKLAARRHVKTVALCVIASDTGLCGNYNHNVLQAAETFLQNYRGKAVKVIAVGKEALGHFKKHYTVVNSYLGLFGRYSAKAAAELSNELITMFMRGEADEIHIAYTGFSPSLRHKAVVEKFLNIEYGPVNRSYYICEPQAEEILDKVLPAYLFHKVRTILLDAFTAEHSARMLAMKTATDNAGDLIDKLVLMRNKARQFAITKEVLEIAMSAEALKG